MPSYQMGKVSMKTMKMMVAVVIMAMIKKAIMRMITPHLKGAHKDQFANRRTFYLTIGMQQFHPMMSNCPFRALSQMKMRGITL